MTWQIIKNYSKMRIHKEGKKIIPWIILILIIADISVLLSLNNGWIKYSILILSAVTAFLVVHFFRIADRKVAKNENHILSPADGEIVEIIKIFEKEYFKEERLQVSIFMSIIDIHQNFAPVVGEIVYQKYIKGAFYPAFVKKSSEKNERCSTVFKMINGTEIMARQIAGTVAQRIVTYKKPGDKVEQGEEYGFIKFGSRVDLFLPLDFKINVELHQKSVSNVTVIATT
jgi:phosphatidylserine decarboxylase